MPYDPDPVANAARAISDLRQRFSADVCAEAWRRLGGIEAVNEWKERTRSMPNSGPEVTLNFNEASMRDAIMKITRDMKDAGKPREFKTITLDGYRLPYKPGCGCDSCDEMRQEDPSLTSVLAANAVETYDAEMIGLVTNTAVEVIVRNLKICDPADVATALRILASGPTKRCAFCSAGPGDMHSTACPFSAAYTVAPTRAAQPKPAAPRPSALPGMANAFGTVIQRDGKPMATLGPVPQRSSAAPKDSILNPPVKGFIGSDKYGYDPDVD